MRESLVAFLNGVDGMQSMAYEMTSDPNQKFSLALELGLVEEANTMLTSDQLDMEGDNGVIKHKRMSETALKLGRISLAVPSLKAIEDWNTLMLIAICVKDAELLEEVAQMTEQKFL